MTAWKVLTVGLVAVLLLAAGCGSDSDSPPDPTDVPTLVTPALGVPAESEGPPAPPPIGDLLELADVTVAPFPTIGTGSDAGIEQLEIGVVAVYPHDPEAFTQGLLFDNGRMYESTGLWEASTLREVDFRSGEVLRQITLADTDVGKDMNFFAEGLALVDDGQGGSRLIQLTWEDQMAFSWDTETFHETAEPADSYRYKGEGWGLCYDGSRLAMSNGTSVLNFHTPESFAMVGESLMVTRNGSPVELLNELECVGDDIWANVWLSDEIVRIDSSTGEVTAVVDASPLTASLGAGCGGDSGTTDAGGSQATAVSDVVAAIQDANLPLPCVTDQNAVLNGIAYDDTTGRFFLTGKNWPLLFEVRF